jgi:hypothetical protein
MLYIRYESASPNERGRHVGIFGLANGLARSGELSPADWAWWRESNDWLTAAYIDPGTVDPTIFDKRVHPHISCWFNESATHLLDRVPGYLAILDRHGVAWAERRSLDPGVVIYEDADQVVVVPRAAAPEGER